MDHYLRFWSENSPLADAVADAVGAVGAVAGWGVGAGAWGADGFSICVCATGAVVCRRVEVLRLGFAGLAGAGGVAGMSGGTGVGGLMGAGFSSTRRWRGGLLRCGVAVAVGDLGRPTQEFPGALVQGLEGSDHAVQLVPVHRYHARDYGIYIYLIPIGPFCRRAVYWRQLQLCYGPPRWRCDNKVQPGYQFLVADVFFL
jgi:hypothetical protein